MVGIRVRRRACAHIALALAVCSAAVRAQIVDTLFVDDFETCSDAAQLIYAFDAGGALVRLDPRLIATPATAFASLGTPACTLGSPLPGWVSTVPLSMALDVHGKVWALYSSGELFRIDPATLACEALPFASSASWQLFQMAFSGHAETRSQWLYVSGGSAAFSAPGNFGRIDPANVAGGVQTIGPLGGSADETVPLATVGTDVVYGFYPRFVATTQMQQIDRSTGALLGNPLTVIDFDGNSTQDWAFAHWGGEFWIFLNNGIGTALVTVDLVTGMGQFVVGGIPYTPVAAATSTCAPTTLN